MDRLSDGSRFPTPEEQAESLEIDLITRDWANALNEGNLDDSVCIADRMIKKYPNKAIGYRHLSSSKRFLGHFHDSIIAARMAVELDPCDATNDEVLVKALAAGGFKKFAADAAREALNMDRNVVLSNLKKRYLNAKSREEKQSIMKELRHSPTITKALKERTDIMALLMRNIDDVNDEGLN